MNNRHIVDQYKVRECCALTHTRQWPQAPFVIVECLDAPEYVPSGSHEGWESKYTQSRVITGLGVMR